MNGLRSEEGAETVQIIIGIVVFVIFGLTVFGMVTNTAGKKSAIISNCFADTGRLMEIHNKFSSKEVTNKTCVNSDYGEDPETSSYNGDE